MGTRALVAGMAGPMLGLLLDLGLVRQLLLGIVAFVLALLLLAAQARREP